MNRTYRRRGVSGMTLVELLVVIAIIGILAALVVSMSTYASRKTYRAKAASGLEKLKSGIEEYRVEYGRYPTNVTLVTNYLRDLTPEDFLDPWGRAYLYATGSTPFVYKLLSAGPDGITNTADDVDTSTGVQ